MRARAKVDFDNCCLCVFIFVVVSLRAMFSLFFLSIPEEKRDAHFYFFIFPPTHLVSFLSAFPTPLCHVFVFDYAIAVEPLNSTRKPQKQQKTKKREKVKRTQGRTTTDHLSEYSQRMELRSLFSTSSSQGSSVGSISFGFDI